MAVRLGVCLVFSLYNNWTDWKEGRVHNRMPVFMTLLGLAWWGFNAGWRGLGASAAGGAVMLALFPLFAFRMLGAGDIKALMGIGFLLGFPAAVFALAYSLLGGGAAACCVLLLRKNGRKRLGRLWIYFKNCWLLKKPLPYAQRLGEGEGGFRFTFGISLGLLAFLVETVWKG